MSTEREQKIKIIDEIVSDVYTGVKEPTEASEEIMKIIKGW